MLLLVVGSPYLLATAVRLILVAGDRPDWWHFLMFVSFLTVSCAGDRYLLARRDKTSPT